MLLQFFYAPWCEVCTSMKPVIEKLAKKYGVDVQRLNVDEAKNKDERVKWTVRTVPTFIFLNESAMIDRVEGEISYERGVNWFEDVLGITLEKERRGELPLVE